MSRVMPSQIVQTIDLQFPHASKDIANAPLYASHSSQMLGILNLLKDVPDELIVLSPADYSDFVLAKSTIEEHLAIWRSRGPAGQMGHVNGRDPVTIIRGILAKCPDAYPPSAVTEFFFIKDADLRDDILRDLGAVNRALNNSEWKAANVLAGAAIEALLLWRLQQSPPQPRDVAKAVDTLVTSGKINKPNNDMDRWELHHFIEVAAHLDLIGTDTAAAANLARSFRNLIHPGRVARLAQTCDRATAYSAVGALEHVVRDLRQ